MGDSSDFDSDSSDSVSVKAKPLIKADLPERSSTATPPPKLSIQMSSASSSSSAIDFSKLPPDDEKHHAIYWMEFMIRYFPTTPIMKNLRIFKVENEYFAKSFLCAQMEVFIRTNTPSMLEIEETNSRAAFFINNVLYTILTTSRETSYIQIEDLTLINFKTALMLFFREMGKYYTERGAAIISSVIVIPESEAIADAFCRCLCMVNEKVEKELRMSQNPLTSFILRKTATVVFIGNETYHLNKRDFEQLVIDSSSLHKLSQAVAMVQGSSSSSFSSSSSSSEPSHKRRALEINTANEGAGLESQESTPPQSPSNNLIAHPHKSPEKRKIIVALNNERVTRQKTAHFDSSRSHQNPSKKV